MDDGKIRLDFTREKTTLEELHKEQNQYVTRSFQGTFFYEYDDVIYTQKRVLGSKIYIRSFPKNKKIFYRYHRRKICLYYYIFQK